MNAEKIKLRPVEDDDLSLLHELLNDRKNQQLVGGSVKPMSRGEVLDWLNHKRSDDKTFIFSIVRRGDFVGYLLITSVDSFNGHAVFGINILRSEQGKGIGPVGMALVHKFCKEKLSLRKLVLYVRADNHFAIRLYHKLGYKKVGSLLNHMRVGDKYVDHDIMELFL